MFHSKVAGKLLKLCRKVSAVILACLKLAHAAIHLEHLARPNFLILDLFTNLVRQKVSLTLHKKHLDAEHVHNSEH